MHIQVQATYNAEHATGAYLLVRPRLPALVSLGGLNLLALVRAAVQGVYLLVRPRL